MAGTAPLPKLDELVELAPASLPAPRSRPSSLSGIERFTLIKRLGEGGMGCVYEAYDSTLDRKVAVKLVRADRRRSGDPIEPRDQLLREAQAMARLAHPNVVAVHEVGEIKDDIYVVLELVEGTTLKDWLRERPRSWRAIVLAFVQAGRGLAAAHEVGLVHRDFKPTNTLVRRDGRVQVTDFGVASMGSARDTQSGETTAVGDITFAGRRVGTPAYMSPEQHAMAPVDARADQFSFCVSLWEALYGARPFPGGIEQLRQGRIASPASTARVPRWLEGVLRRGLAYRPEDRWPGMDELLERLERDPGRTRLRRLAIAGTALAIVAIAAVAWAGWTRPAPAVEPCDRVGAETHLANRWDPARRSTLQAAFVASGAPYAADGAARVVGQLDAWTPQWVTMRVDVCRATRISGEQSETLLDARMRCLDRQLDEVSQLVDALITTDRAIIARAAETLALPELAACADHDAVLARVPTAAVAHERIGQISQVEHELAGIRTAERIGRYHDARMRAVALWLEVAKLDFAPLGAETLLVRGQLEEQDGDLAAARASLVEATRLAAIAKDDHALAEALISLLGVLVARAEVPAALALGIAADAATARAGHPELTARLAEQLGAAHDAAGDAEAETQFRRALALREAAGPDSVAVAQVLNRLAGVDARRGRTSDARLGYERAHRIVSARLGPQHPATAIAHANVCFLDAEAGQLSSARTCQEDVLVVLENALGREHPQVAWALNEVGLVQRAQGDLAGAEHRFERALAIWERASGTTHPDLAWPLINLGELANGRGDVLRGEALCRRALELAGTARLGDLAEVPALACLATALLARSPRVAATTARRALDLLRDRGRTADPEIAFTLARALAATDPAAGIEIARAALVDATGPVRAELAGWLARRAKGQTSARETAIAGSRK